MLGDLCGEIGVLVRVEVGRHLFLEVFLVDQISVGPTAGTFQIIVGSLVVGERDIAYLTVMDIVFFLCLLDIVWLLRATPLIRGSRTLDDHHRYYAMMILDPH